MVCGAALLTAPGKLGIENYLQDTSSLKYFQYLMLKASVFSDLVRHLIEQMRKNVMLSISKRYVARSVY